MRLPEALTIPNAENTFCGVPIAQTWTDLAIWEEFLNRHDIASMIELGTWKGGMATFLAAQCLARSIRFSTVESQMNQVQDPQTITQLGGTLVHADIFQPGLLADLIGQMSKPLLVLCDNGNKRAEIREVAQLLSPGDFAAVHDWLSECGPGDIPHTWHGVMAEECENMSSITRFFVIR